MADIKELKDRIDGITEMRKITNAMYLIASVKLQQAKVELEKTRPSFNILRREMQRIFRADAETESDYFYPVDGPRDEKTTIGFLIITSDKGLAGAYSSNIIKRTLEHARECIANRADDTEIFVVGEHGRQYFRNRGLKFVEEFDYPARTPSYHRASEIAKDLMNRYKSGEIDELRVLYTDYKNGMLTKVRDERVLPFKRTDFFSSDVEASTFEFRPSIGEVLKTVVQGYVTNFIFSALVDSFCSEQSARMNAMDTANRNASELLAELKLEYNHARQSAITREITEISSGYKHRRENPSE